MPLDLLTWLRPNFVANAGEPFLLFAAFGALDLAVPIDRAKYRAAGVPKACELLLYERQRQPTSFQHLWQSHAWGLAAAESSGLAEAANAAPQFAILRGHIKNSETLDYLRDVVGIVQYLCDRGASTVFDPQAFQFWSAADWKDRLFAPAAPVPHEHVIILETPDDGADTAWIHTQGLRKFGRPDLSVRAVGSAQRERIVELFNHLVEHLAGGGTILDGERVTFAGLPPGGVFQVDTWLDHPEFHNAHVELVWSTSEMAR
jgi:hypothetical protein